MERPAQFAGTIRSPSEPPEKPRADEIRPTESPTPLQSRVHRQSQRAGAFGEDNGGERQRQMNGRVSSDLPEEPVPQRSQKIPHRPHHRAAVTGKPLDVRKTAA